MTEDEIRLIETIGMLRITKDTPVEIRALLEALQDNTSAPWQSLLLLALKRFGPLTLTPQDIGGLLDNFEAIHTSIQTGANPNVTFKPVRMDEAKLKAQLAQLTKPKEHGEN